MHLWNNNTLIWMNMFEHTHRFVPSHLSTSIQWKRIEMNAKSDARWKRHAYIPFAAKTTVKLKIIIAVGDTMLMQTFSILILILKKGLHLMVSRKTGTSSYHVRFCPKQQSQTIIWSWICLSHKHIWLGKGWSLGYCLLFNCVFVTFPCGILGQVWYLIVSIPDLCRLSYF